MNRIKQLNEQRGAKLKEAAALSTDTAEGRAKLEALHKDIEGIDQAIILEARQIELAGKQAPQLSAKEEREVATFDFSKFLRHLKSVSNGGITRVDGIEAEMIAEGEKEARNSLVSVSGIHLPSVLLRSKREVRDLTATGTTSVTGDQGGMTIATNKAGLIDALYEKTFAAQLGGMVLSGLTGNLDLPRYVAASDPAHKTENDTAAEYTPTTAMLSLTPKRLPTFVDISDQLMLQSSSTIEAIVRRNLETQARALIEKMILHGSGGSGQPTGIFGTTGVGVVYAGGASSNGTNADGAAPVWADMIAFETALGNANADVGSVAYLFNSRTRGKLKSTLRASSTDSMFIWDDRAGGLVNGYKPYVSNCVSNTLSKGASSSILSGGVFANWADLVLAFWGGLSFELIRDQANAKVGQHTLVLNSYYDCGAIRPASFVVCKDFLTT